LAGIGHGARGQNQQGAKLELHRKPEGFGRLLRPVERVVVLSLLIMMIMVVIVLTAELGYMLVEHLLTGPGLPLNDDEIHKTFSFFLLILIGLELMETIKMYLDRNQIHVEVVFLVAMIAVARKIIIMDAEKVPAMTKFGVAALILALSVGYYLVKRIHLKQDSNQDSED
jgi:uncharacterized membrane protein (DUF373 family)